MDITIPEDKFRQIMTCLGGRFIEEDDLEISFEEIKQDIIAQAILEYFRWYPLTGDPFTVDVQSSFSIPFPDDKVFSVVDVRQNTSRVGYGPYGNAFIDERFIRSSGSYGYNSKYGTRNDYGFTAVNTLMRSEKQATLESTKTFKWHVNEQERRLTGFTNTLSTVSITWARWSNDWSHIAFSQERDVIKLCQSYILRFFADLRSQDQVDGAPIDFDVSAFSDRADKLEEEVMEKWKMKASPILMRN